jgi:hypothetical protein
MLKINISQKLKKVSNSANEKRIFTSSGETHNASFEQEQELKISRFKFSSEDTFPE